MNFDEIRIMLSIGSLFYLVGLETNSKYRTSLNYLLSHMVLPIIYLIVAILFAIDGMIVWAVVEGSIFILYLIVILMGYNIIKDKEEK